VKMVNAVIKPFSLDPVKAAVAGLGVGGITVIEARGFGRQRGRTEVYRGAEYVVEFIPKVQIEILTTDEEAERVAEAIVDAASSGKIGDGKVWITPVDTVIRVRTRERGEDAL
jgi:nitrogen regulatory protein P-II 1